MIACARDKSNASLLDELASGSENISIEELDIANPSSIESAANNIGDNPIDTVIIVAGDVGGDPMEQQSLDNIDIAQWHKTLDTNTIGPLLVARAFKNNLTASGLSLIHI